MPKYAVKIGEIHVTAEVPISPELRAAMLKAVEEAFKEFDANLGAGAEMVFRVEKA